MVAMKIITAAVSYATAIAVYRLIPLALLIPSPIQLEREINERKAAQGKLQSRYERSMVTSQVTREIRRILQLEAICSSTAGHCAALFNADECTLYRHKRKKPKPKPAAPLEERMEEKDSQCQGEEWETERTRRDCTVSPREGDHHYSVLSKHVKARSGGDSGTPPGDHDEIESTSPRQRRQSSLRRKPQLRAPPLHLLPKYVLLDLHELLINCVRGVCVCFVCDTHYSFLCQHYAVVIDVAQGLALTHNGEGIKRGTCTLYAI
jgi:hypothetical protein